MAKTGPRATSLKESCSLPGGVKRYSLVLHGWASQARPSSPV